jgi:hypothetical protein
MKDSESDYTFKASSVRTERLQNINEIHLHTVHVPVN